MKPDQLVNIDALPQEIRDSIVSHQKENGIAARKNLSLETALKYYLEWNGIIGFTQQIFSIFQAAKA